ncbi:MAG TPA: aldo/keto reductase [Novosphingobium sp.]|nr:aldo/keto reductase [Novosphingobium sp.]
MVDYRYLGRSGLQVSPLTLGTMMFGGETDEPTAHRIIDTAREQGINFIDTADGYNKGASEEVVGRGIKAHRDHWILATKFANPRGPGPNQRGQSRKWIIESVENSLRRLGTDHIDILYFHRAIFDAPLGEAVRAIADLIRAGKLRYFGVSNFRAWRLAEVAHLADQLNIDRPIASQPLYNIVNRVAEAEQLPAASFYGLGVVSYSPLARGVLTGKYHPGVAPGADTRAGRADKRILETEWRPESVALAAQIAEHARARGIDPVAFAIAWVLNNRLVTSTITGPRTEAHWASYIKALDVQLTAEDEAFIDGLVTTGHASTHGFNDPSHPIEGRVPRSHNAPAPLAVERSVRELVA